MRLIKNGDTTHLIHVLMIDSTDHVSPKTGLTLTVTRSKNGAAFAAWAGTSAEVANGWYKLTPSAGDVDTQGDLVIHVTGTGADPTDAQALVVAFDPHAVADLGLTRIDAAITSRASQASLDTVDDYLDTEIAALTASVAALPTANATADALLDRANGIETGLTLRQAMRLLAAAEAGKLSGAATTTIVIRNAVADSKNRITATVDANGNRSAITTDVT